MRTTWKSPLQVWKFLPFCSIPFFCLLVNLITSIEFAAQQNGEKSQEEKKEDDPQRGFYEAKIKELGQEEEEIRKGKSVF